MKISKKSALSGLAALAVGLFGVVNSAKAFFVVAPVVLYIGLGVLGLGTAYNLTRPEMTERQAFIHYLNPDEVNAFVHWQQQGSFVNGDYGPYSKIAAGLVDFRAHLKSVVVDQRHDMTEAAFDEAYGPDRSPNFCAVSREAIAASFLEQYGYEARDKIWKFLTCTP